MMRAGWRVVQVMAGAEFAVSAAITAAGIECYCPSFTTRKPNRHGNRDEMIESTKALFPGYLFIRPDARFQKEAFETARIKLQVFYNSPVGDAVIEAVKETAAEASKVPPERKLEPGDFATLLRGVLKGESAVILRVRGQQALIDVARGDRRAVLLVGLSDLTLDEEAPSRVANSGT